jgi:hypothetical protein
MCALASSRLPPDVVAPHGMVSCCRYGDSGEAQLEVPRLTPYLSNGLFIVSERGVEPEQEAALDGMLVFVPKDQRKVGGWGLRKECFELEFVCCRR